MSLLLLILGLVLFVALVVVHEFGHFIMAKRSGVEVEEFGVGFPPRAKVLTRHNGTVYTLNWLPLGGFVRLKGEHDADKSEGSYGSARLRDKIKIMLAGVFMNLATAFVLLTLLALIGLPKLIDNQFTIKSDTKIVRNDVLIGDVEPGSPATKTVSEQLVTKKVNSTSNKTYTLVNQVANPIRQRDQIVSMSVAAGSENQAVTQIKTNNDLSHFTSTHPDQSITIIIKRDNRLIKLGTKIRSRAEIEASIEANNQKGYLGVIPTEYTLQRSTWSAPIVAAGLIKQFTVLTFQGLGKAIGGLASGNTAQASAQVSGPVGIFVLLNDGSSLGYQFILMIIAIISLTLAIMNGLPIPALDGGRLFVTLLFRVFKKPLTRRREDVIHGTGFALLMVLFVLVTIVDVKRNF